MGLNTQTEVGNAKISSHSSLMRKVPDVARILIVCDDASITDGVNKVLREAGLISECVESMSAGCASARSGQYQVVFTKPVLSDGSWRRLVDIASHYDLGFEVVLVASTFDFNEWAEALGMGHLTS